MSKNQISVQVAAGLQEARELKVQVQINLLSLKTKIPTFFESESDWEGLLQQQGGFVERLDGLIKEVSKAERERTQEAADDHEPRRLRDEAYEELRQMMAEGRSHLENGLGIGSGARYGFTGPLRRKPTALALLAGNVIDLMEANPQQRTNHFGSGANTADVVGALRPLKDLLDIAISNVSREIAEYREVLSRRDDALDNLHAGISFVLNSHIALLELCKRDDLTRAARTIRRTLRRVSATTSSDATEAAEQPDAAAETPSSDNTP